MFSEVPGGTVKRALCSTTTSRATGGAVIGLGPSRSASIYKNPRRDAVIVTVRLLSGVIRLKLEVGGF